VGEVVAAVNFLHESGFCYGDLKPENILITELGHIKVNIFYFLPFLRSCVGDKLTQYITYSPDH